MTDAAAKCCDEPKSVLRCRTIRGGAKQAITQCKSCGYYGSKGYRAVGKKDWPSFVTNVEMLPPFDEDALRLADERIRDREVKREITSRGNPDGLAKSKAFELKRLQQDLARREAERAERAAYYRSGEWAMVRRRVMQRARGICEGCCITPASEVHHMTYENFGKEFLWELKAVCKACHERYHRPQQDRDAAIRRGELPYEGFAGPVMTRVVEGLEIENEEDNESGAA